MQHFINLCNAASKAALFISVSLFAAPLLQAQEFKPDLLQLPEHTTKHSQPVQGVLNIVAVMVEFQPDDNDFTSGNGTFSPGSLPYLDDPGTNIDPPPHNKAYFEAHLEFAKNYFETNSNGQFTIEYQVLDQVFQLPNEMKEYSPIGEDPSPLPLAEFAKDVWETVGESGDLNLEFSPDSQTAFIVFHAGVGRDIQLVGTTLDKTPQDIPSVYLSRGAISRLFDDPAFSGFPIDNGNVLVDNTLILPRTLSRAGEDISGNTFVLPLSINGMVTAQIGSHIGLPDLFNTETGESGIGRFGLMDGAGIFAYNGLFPPELSAWEKIRLGWQQPFTVNPATEQSINLPAAVLRDPNSIAKIPVSADEYFLVENRHRDIDNQGITLTIQRPDGSMIDQTFTNADTSFVFQLSGFADDLEPGVVTNVNNFDFALPGGPVGAIDEFEEGRTLNGGILIWHIDEAVIRSQLAARAGINDNPDRRGVNLQEADGAQDIGRPTQIGISQNNPNGYAFDFWWSGNNATVITQTGEITLYENRFGPDTTPNNNTNSGAPAFFELYDFSEILPTANVNIRPADPNSDLYTLADSRQNLPFSYFSQSDGSTGDNYPLGIIPFSIIDSDYALIPAQDGVHIYNIETKVLTDLASTSEVQQPFFVSDGSLFNISERAGSQQEISNTLYEWDGSNFNELESFDSPSNPGFISTQSSGIIQFDGTRARANLSPLFQFDPEFYDTASQFSETINGYSAFLDNNGMLTFTTPQQEISVQLPYGRNEVTGMHTGLIQKENGTYLPYVYTSKNLFLLNQGEIETLFESDRLHWPALVDYTGDNNIDFILVDAEKNQLIAKNRNGAVLNNFPIRPPAGIEFTGTPLVADLNDDGHNEIIITGQDQYTINLYAYNRNGRQVAGFPLFVGNIQSKQNHPVQAAITGNHLVAISHTGDFWSWTFPNLGTVLWASRYGNSGNNKVTGTLALSSVQPPSFGVLNKAETYNWPNPATDQTFIRFQTEDAGEVRVRIATTSGRLVYDRTVDSRGGMPEEIEIDTSGWGSGGYMAVVSATVNGRTERKLVKIAIAR